MDSFSSELSTGNDHRLHPITEILPSSLLSESLESTALTLSHQNNRCIISQSPESPSISSADDQQHQKTHWITYMIFYLLGVGMLFPWNVFITCREYFVFRLTGSTFADNFDHFFSSAFTLSNVLVLVYLNFVQGNAVSRMRVALIINALVFTICVILTQLSSQVSNYQFFYANISLVILSGSSTAFLQNGVFGLASQFPTIYMQAVMSGQGLAGAAVSISQIMSQVASIDKSSGSVQNPSFSAFLYFGFALFVILICFVSAVYLQFLDTFKQHARFSSGNFTSIEEPVDIKASAKIISSLPKVDLCNVFIRILPMAMAIFMVFFLTLSLFPPIISVIESVNRDKSKNIFTHDLFNPSSFLIFALGDWLGKSLPGFPPFKLPYIGLILNFAKPSKAYSVLFLSLSRVVFIPLVLMCNIVLRDPVTKIPIGKSLHTLFSSDLAYFLILLVFAVSNGWLASLAMMHGPQMVTISPKHKKYQKVSSIGSNYQHESSGSKSTNNGDDGDDGDENIESIDECYEDENELMLLSLEKQTAGSFMVFILTLGLACGSAFSFVLRSAICGWCNPFLH